MYNQPLHRIHRYEFAARATKSQPVKSAAWGVTSPRHIITARTPTCTCTLDLRHSQYMCQLFEFFGSVQPHVGAGRVRLASSRCQQPTPRLRHDWRHTARRCANVGLYYRVVSSVYQLRHGPDPRATPGYSRASRRATRPACWNGASCWNGATALTAWDRQRAWHDPTRMALFNCGAAPRGWCAKMSLSSRARHLLGERRAARS